MRTLEMLVLWFFSLIEMKSTCHKIHPFPVCNSVVFNIFRVVQHSPQSNFRTIPPALPPPRRKAAPLSSHSLSPPDSPTPGSQQSFLLCGFAYSGHFQNGVLQWLIFCNWPLCLPMVFVMWHVLGLCVVPWPSSSSESGWTASWFSA